MRRERDDLGTLGIAVVVVALTWPLLLGWSWPLAVYGFDDLTLPGVLAIREMVEVRDGWSALVYRPELLGGVKIANVAGRFPLYSLGARVGLSTMVVAVFSAFIVQALLGWLGCRTAMDLTKVWSVGARRLTALERVAVVWLCAFAPVLGWRFGVGHPGLVVGLLPLAASMALVAATAARTPTLTVVAVCTAAVALGVLHLGQQIVVYSAVFGAPLLLGVWISLGGAWRRVALPALVMAGAILLALPALWGILEQTRSSDSPRVLGGASITYGFVTATASDWLTSLPWLRPSPPAGFRSTFAHEVNYPVGPLLILLLLVPWRRARTLGLGLAVSLVGIVAFSMDLAPVSRALLAALPPLNVFRVPARSALIWLWVLPIIAVAALVHRDAAATTEHRGGSRALAAWLAIPVGGVLLLLPSLVREIGAALLATGVVVLMLRGRPLKSTAVVLVLLGLFSVAAFGERLSAFQDPQAIFAEAQAVGAAVRQANAGLDSALTRVRLDIEVPPLAANTAFATGLSALDGYAVPTRRFSTLVSAVRGDRYEPTTNFLRFIAADPALGVLRQLYNVTHAVTLTSPRSLAIMPLGPTAGAAWFSASVAPVDDLQALAGELRGAAGMLHARAREILWRDAGDPLTAKVPLPPALDARCRDARIFAVHAPRRHQEIVAEVASATTCPLTFAMNFTEDLRAVATLEGGRRVAAPVFPGYGALASVLVPAGATAVSVRAEPVRLRWAFAFVALGMACCAGAAGLTRFG